MHIRFYRPDELPAILQRSYQTAQGQVAQRELVDATPAGVASQINQMFQVALQTPGGTILVADWPPDIAGAGPAGYVLLLLQPNPFTGAREIFVLDIFTDPRLRGRGLGKALLEYARWYGRSLGCNGIGAQVALQNQESLRLFARSGFQQERLVLGKRC